ncbi:MAG: metallophosphoesterase [Bacteroidales bacterium]|nr:metallophosphoesterase [Bacteroidales bacterium]HPV16632.1 metallophosphoesterase [Bacteroidales bacterium]
MGLFIVLAVTELLTLAVIRQYLYERSWLSYYFAITIHVALSIWIWILWFKTVSFRGMPDDPAYEWSVMNLRGMLMTVVVPRILIIAGHYTGKRIFRASGTRPSKPSIIAIVLASIIFVVLSSGALIGRFNFRTESHVIRIKGLDPGLEGFRIVHISDLHLPCFYHHHERLAEVMQAINELEPDLIVNTGDFINLGWREFDSFDTILSKAKARYGQYAVMGNHDFGTYHPTYTDAERENNVRLMKSFIEASGYKVLNDEFEMLNTGSSSIALIGVTTSGSFPDIVHGDLEKASEKIYGEDLKILLAHDPNQWDRDVAGKTDISLTLSGHTHGMQVGIYTKLFKWSPAKYFYPRWDGVHELNGQYLVVNRGLGVLGIPFRIWIPPEITVITLMPG